jgi:hypothetical protein
MRLIAAFLALGVVLAAPASPQSAPSEGVPELLRQALSPPASSQLYAYDFEDVIHDKDGKRIVRGTVDPTRRKGDRVTITYLEDRRGKPASLQETDRRYEKNADGDIFCDTASREDVAQVVDKGKAPGGGRVFGFVPKPEPQTEGMIRDLMSKMSVEAVVDEISGLLRSFSAKLMRKHNVMLFGEVKSATYTAQCATLPAGRAYTARTNLDALVSAMGQSYRQKSVQLITNVRPAG